MPGFNLQPVCHEPSALTTRQWLLLDLTFVYLVRIPAGDLLRSDVQEVHPVQRSPLEQGESRPGPSLVAPEAELSQRVELGLLQVTAVQV